MNFSVQGHVDSGTLGYFPDKKNAMDAAKARIELRNKRRQLSVQQQAVMAEQITANLTSQAFFLRAKRVGIYFANDGEADPSIIIDICQKSGKKCFLPIIHPLKAKRLHFAYFNQQSTLVNNRFGIPEPCLRRAKLVPPWSLDLVLMPLVGFDSQGNRIGMGGGFYDRTFAFTAKNLQPAPRLIGLAYSFQELEKINPQPWDIAVSGIVTEKRVY